MGTDTTLSPTNATFSPTQLPSENPTKHPTKDPTANSTSNPSNDPNMDPTVDPTVNPTFNPTLMPSMLPSFYPTGNPSVSPSKHPSELLSISFTTNPTKHPIIDPTLVLNVLFIESTNNDNINNALDEKTTSNDSDIFIMIIATCVSIIIFLICIVFGLCLYVKKRKTTKNKLKLPEMSTIASISLQSIGKQSIHTIEDQDRKRNESTANEEMYNKVITPQHRESDSNEMYKVNEETTQQIEKEKSDDEEEQLYVEENGNMTTVTTIDENTQMTTEGDLTVDGNVQTPL